MTHATTHGTDCCVVTGQGAGGSAEQAVKSNAENLTRRISGMCNWELGARTCAFTKNER